jgi:hypothetical protein
VEIVIISASSFKVERRAVVDRVIHPLKRKYRTITLIYDREETVTYSSVPIRRNAPIRAVDSSDEQQSRVYRMTRRNASDSSGSGDSEDSDEDHSDYDWTRTEMDKDLVQHGRDVQWMRDRRLK